MPKVVWREAGGLASSHEGRDSDHETQQAGMNSGVSDLAEQLNTHDDGKDG